jgi:hypothetical protein
MRKTASLKPQFSKSTDQKAASKPAPSPVTLRLTEEERAMLKEWSQGSSMSAYIRKCLFEDQESRRKKPRRPEAIADHQALAQVLGMLGSSRIANNLNQLAFHANTGSLIVDQETTDKINEAYSHICTLRLELLKALGSKRLEEWGDTP